MKQKETVPKAERPSGQSLFYKIKLTRPKSKKEALRCASLLLVAGDSTASLNPAVYMLAVAKHITRIKIRNIWLLFLLVV